MATAPAPGAVSQTVQPQTTGQPPGGPFIRYSQPGSRQMYNTAISFGGSVTQPLPSAPGYLRKLRFTVTASGGVNGTVTVAAAADAPYNIFSLVQFKDAYGNPLIVGDGYSILKLLPMYSGQFGLDGSADVANLPSFAAVSVGTTGTGDFTVSGALPAEFAKGIGVISMANSSLLPNVNLQVATSGSLYTTAPGTLPTMSLELDADFYWLPQGQPVVPISLGTTQQWVVQQATPGIGSGASARVGLPRLGGYITTLVLILRDSTGARIDAWPARVQVYIDGIPIWDDPISKVYDDMFIQFGGTSGSYTRPTGVIAFTRKTSMSQKSLGLLDTGETLLSTNPGTLIEVNGSPWGAITNAPATLNVLVGMVVPVNQLTTGLPEV
jgi:hypothetical protein